MAKKKYKVEIPDQVQDVITGMGYTPENWIEAQLTALMPVVDKNKSKELLVGKEAEIAANHAAVKSQIKVEEE